MVIVLLLTGAVSLLLLLASHKLIYWWAGPTVNPPMLLLVGLAIWTVMESCGSALAAFLNGSGFLYFQIVTAGIFGISCITAKIYLARRARYRRAPLGHDNHVGPAELDTAHVLCALALGPTASTDDFRINAHQFRRVRLLGQVRIEIAARVGSHAPQPDLILQAWPALRRRALVNLRR